MFENFKVPDNLRPSDPRFGSGPSLIPVDFMNSLAKTGTELLGTSHRKPAVKNLFKEVQDGLREYFNLPEGYEVIVGNGGATFLFDMIGLGLVEKKSVHYTCGEFSSKWYKSHSSIPWIDAQNIASEYGCGVSPKDHDDADMICVTLNETSTGVHVPTMPEVDNNTILAVDATSGGGQCPCDLSKVDLYFLSPQKVFASEGGLFVAIMSPKALERARRLNEQDRYIPPIMNWVTAIDNSLKNQTYNTPSISTVFFLNEQVKLMNKIGYEEVQALAKKKAEFIYNWAREKEYLNPYVQNEADRSWAVATIDVDEKYPAGDLIKVLEEQKAVYGIDAYRKLGRNQFRIALFHNIKFEDIKKLTEIISLAIES